MHEKTRSLAAPAAARGEGSGAARPSMRFGRGLTDDGDRHAAAAVPSPQALRPAAPPRSRALSAAALWQAWNCLGEGGAASALERPARSALLPPPCITRSAED